MGIVHTTHDNFEEVVLGNDIVIIDFWAEWCGPCKSFAPVFEEASETYKDIIFAKVNTEEEQELAAAFDVQSIPTLMVFREKVLIFQEAGAMPRKVLDELISKVKELDMAEVHAEIARHEEEHGHGHCHGCEGDDHECCHEHSHDDEDEEEVMDDDAEEEAKPAKKEMLN